jgi:hypothetical protein
MHRGCSLSLTPAAPVSRRCPVPAAMSVSRPPVRRPRCVARHAWYWHGRQVGRKTTRHRFRCWSRESQAACMCAARGCGLVGPTAEVNNSQIGPLAHHHQPITVNPRRWLVFVWANCKLPCRAFLRVLFVFLNPLPFFFFVSAQVCYLQLWPCLVHPKTKIFSRFSVTSNLVTHAWSIKYRWK